MLVLPSLPARLGFNVIEVLFLWFSWQRNLLSGHLTRRLWPGSKTKCLLKCDKSSSLLQCHKLPAQDCWAEITFNGSEYPASQDSPGWGSHVQIGWCFLLFHRWLGQSRGHPLERCVGVASSWDWRYDILLLLWFTQCPGVCRESQTHWPSIKWDKWSYLMSWIFI